MGLPPGVQRVVPAGSAVTGVNAWLLTRMAHEITRRLDLALAGSDLSADSWRVLDYLGAHGPCTMTSLANAASINGATLTRLTDRLVASALVYRSADVQDRRRVLVHLSERGQSLVTELRPAVLAAEADATTALSAAERDQLTHLLRRITPEVVHG